VSLPVGRSPRRVPFLRELLQALVGLLPGLRLGVDRDGLGERCLRLVVHLLRGLLVAALLGDPALVAEEDAPVEPALLEVGIGLEHRVDLAERALDVAAVEERDRVVRADARLGGLLLPRRRVDLGGGGEVRAALLEVLVLERGVALVVELVGAGHEFLVAAAGVGLDRLDGGAAGGGGGVVTGVSAETAGDHDHHEDDDDREGAEAAPDDGGREPLGGARGGGAGGRCGGGLGGSRPAALLGGLGLARLAAEGVLHACQVRATLGAELGVAGVVAAFGTVHACASFELVWLVVGSAAMPPRTCEKTV
jgi:hypothetical protein